MSVPRATFDVVVLGSGPGGQKAAIQAAKLKKRVLVIERDSAVGGECVHRGTIPSKTLRETAGSGARAQELGFYEARREQGPPVEVASLMRRKSQVLQHHEQYIGRQLERNQVQVWRGHGHFLSPWEVEVTGVDGSVRVAIGAIVVIATGSRPRNPPNVAIDHENVLDSDSILSLIYLPQSLVVLGSGVIACEYASIFTALGTRVTLIDKAQRPLGFMESELTARFLAYFERQGGAFLAGRTAKRVEWDGVSSVDVELDDGFIVQAEKVLCALGRVANLSRLDIEAAGLKTSARGFIPIDEHCRTETPHIYAVGDVVGPPALAATAMEQGRRAMRHAFGTSTEDTAHTTPVGIYTIPELAQVGLTEAAARQKYGAVLVGCAPFEELARGQINGDRDGLLKLVASPDGRTLLGAHIVCEHASDLIHLAQLAMVANLPVDAFVENIFNFPTLAEAYRVAALEILGRIESPKPVDSTQA